MERADGYQVMAGNKLVYTRKSLQEAKRVAKELSGQYPKMELKIYRVNLMSSYLDKKVNNYGRYASEKSI